MSVQDFHMAKIRAGYLRGIDDEMVKAKTGRGWDEWDRILDACGAAEQGFSGASRHLRNEHEISTWWSNTIIARYYWMRGLHD